jgi:hypothetical protein
MSGKNIFFITLLFGAAYWFLIRAPKKVSFGTPALRLHKLGNPLVFYISLPIINESDVAVDVNGFIGQLFYGVEPLGLITLVSAESIPGFGTAFIQFKAEVGLVGAGLFLYNKITDSEDPLKDWKTILDVSQFSIRGTIKLGPLPISINEQLLEG